MLNLRHRVIYCNFLFVDYYKEFIFAVVVALPSYMLKFPNVSEHSYKCDNSKFPFAGVIVIQKYKKSQNFTNTCPFSFDEHLKVYRGALIERTTGTNRVKRMDVLRPILVAL